MSRVMAGLSALGLGAALLSGCSGGDDGFTDQSAEEIVAASKSDLKGLTAMAVAGTLSSDGQEITLDLHVDTDANCTGSIGVDSGTVELLGVDGDFWMKPDGAAWELFAPGSADQVQAVVGDKWVSMSGEEGFGDLCDLDNLLEQMVEDESDSTTYTKGDAEELEGEQVVPITGEEDDGTSVAYVRVDEPHYLVKMERTEGDSPGSVTMSEFDEAVESEAPAGSDVVDLNSLSG